MAIYAPPRPEPLTQWFMKFSFSRRLHENYIDDTTVQKDCLRFNAL